MKIVLTLNVEPGDVDATHSTGLTSEAFDRLSEALLSAGFEVHRCWAGKPVGSPARAEKIRHPSGDDGGDGMAWAPTT